MKRLLFILGPVIFLLAAATVLAQEPPVRILPPSPSSFTSLPAYRPSDLLTATIFILFGIAGILSFILLVWGGLQWITAGADKDALERARKWVMNALLGLAIVFSAYALIYIVRVLFNVELIQFELAPLTTYVGGSAPTPTPGSGGNPATPTPLPPGNFPTPPPVMTPAPGAGTCTCSGGSVTGDNCVPPAYPLCTAASTCGCYLYPGPTPGPVGGPCVANANCISGFCSSTQDVDGDGYFASYAGGTGVCRANPSDCRDNNANVHPNQTQYFDTPIAGSDWNYDCADSDGDGDPNDRWPRLNCLSNWPPPAPNCRATPYTQSEIAPYDGYINAIPGCGSSLSSNNFVTCKASHLDSCQANPHVFYMGCDMPCVTGNLCTWSQNTACASWSLDWNPVFASYVSGRTTMPCK